MDACFHAEYDSCTETSDVDTKLDVAPRDGGDEQDVYVGRIYRKTQNDLTFAKNQTKITGFFSEC